MNIISFGKIAIITILVNVVYTQVYIPADPFNLLFTEQKIFADGKYPGSLIFRPLFIKSRDLSGNWYVKFRTELFYNTNATNLENTSNKWIGRGISNFNSVNIAYSGKYLMGSIEPYYFFNQNLDYDVPIRVPLLAGLNDNLAHTESPYQLLGVREAQLYLHYKGIGAGYSNANMWWGPGIHSSLMMTNNTTGFSYFMLGTLQERRYNNWGFNGRYIFSKFDKKSLYEPYYNAIQFAFTYYSDPIVTIGLSKAAQIGGTHPNADTVSVRQAMFAFLKGVTAGDATTYRSRWSTDDHTIAGYVETIFPKSKLKLFLEVGRNDIAWDINNLILAPDHSIATVFGFRKYGIFNNSNLQFGMEYAKLFSGRYIDRLFVGPWYNRREYDYSKYDGRYWGAHSGPDSDDFTMYFGWSRKNLSVIPSFNYERHGLQEPWVVNESGGIKYSDINPYPEVKIEYKLDLRYQYKDYFINLYLEHETLNNLEFRDKKRTGTVIWIGVERTLDKINFKKVKNKLLNRN